MDDPDLGSVIAEIGSVHDGSFGNAMKAIDLAATHGADIVKFQTHIAEAETLMNAPMPPYFMGEPRFDYFQRTAFSFEQWKALKDRADDQCVGFMSSPFAIEAVDLLEHIGISAYKVASGEVTNTPLLERMAETGKPVFLSSGMSDWAELDRAVEVLRIGGPLTIMQCTSAYPCPHERVGLNVLDEMRERYGLPVGYSDHTIGASAGIAAAARGATVIEKHITFSRLMYGSDAANGMEPSEFRAFIEALRETWRMVQSPVDKDDLAPYEDMKRIFEKSIVAARDLAEGNVLGRRDLAFKKPGNGIAAWRYRELLGKRIVRSIAADTMLKPDDLA